MPMTHAIRYLYRRCGQQVQFMTDEQKRSVIIPILEELAPVYGDYSWFDASNVLFFMTELMWIKQEGIGSLEDYQTVGRIGRSTQAVRSPRRIGKNTRQREAIYSVVSAYDRKNEACGIMDLETACIKLLQYLNTLEQKQVCFDHVLIDEMECLSQVQQQILAACVAKSEKDQLKITYLSDGPQSLHQQNWLSYQYYAKRDYSVPGRFKILSKDINATRQIAEAAVTMLNQGSGQGMKAVAINPEEILREGERPYFSHYPTLQEEVRQVNSRLKHLTTVRQYALRDVAILAKSKATLEALRKELPGHMAVRCLSLQEVTGLEAKVVFILGTNELLHNDEIDDIERRLLYNAMIVATEILYLSSHQRYPKFMDQVSILTKT